MDNRDLQLAGLREMVELYGSAPSLEQMPRRTLADKGIAGPTAAHVIEEIHTPLNLAYLSVTTGSTAFQNIVGVAHTELAGRIAATHRALELAGIPRGAKLLVTYPPLVNVFPAQALSEWGIEVFFLHRSSRDALLLALCEQQPKAVIGESTFLRVALEDACKMELASLLPKGLTVLAAGTPLDLELLPTVEKLVQGRVCDLYGCQEFGWLTLNGIPLREDISLLEEERGSAALFVGGLPTGDSFPVVEGGHICQPAGRIITYSRVRSAGEWIVRVEESTAASTDTVERTARSILRIKARIVTVSPSLKLNAGHTTLRVTGLEGGGREHIITGPGKTRLFDCLVKAQQDFQRQGKTDPGWIKRR